MAVSTVNSKLLINKTSKQLNKLMKDINNDSIKEAYKLITETLEISKDLLPTYTYEKCILRFLSKIWDEDMYNLLEKLVSKIEFIDSESSDIYIPFCILKYKKFREKDSRYKEFINFTSEKYRNKLFVCFNEQTNSLCINEKTINRIENCINLEEEIYFKNSFFTNYKDICTFKISNKEVDDKEFYYNYNKRVICNYKKDLFSKVLHKFVNKKYSECRDLIKPLLRQNVDKLHVYNILVYCYIQMGMYHEGVYYLDRCIDTSEGKVRWYFINYKLVINRLAGIQGPSSYLNGIFLMTESYRNLKDIDIKDMDKLYITNHKLHFNIKLEDSIEYIREIRNMEDNYNLNFNVYKDINIYSLFVSRDILYISELNGNYKVYNTNINYRDISLEYNGILLRNKEVLKNETNKDKWWKIRIKLDKEMESLMNKVQSDIKIEGTILLIFDEKTEEFPFEHTTLFSRARCYRIPNTEYLTNNKDQLTNNKDLLTNNKDLLTNNKDHLTNNKDHLTNNKDHLTNNKNLLTNNKDLLTNNKDLLTNNNDLLTNNNDLLTNQYYDTVNIKDATFLLDPSLENTYNRITTKFTDIKQEVIENKKIVNSSFVCYFGHGNGSQYLCDSIKNGILFLFGCSSVRLLCLNNFKKNGNIKKFIRNSRNVLGCLYEVTDKDLDIFSIDLLSKKGDVSDLIKSCKLGMKLRYLNGCSIVVYGMPLNIENI